MEDGDLASFALPTPDREGLMGRNSLWNGTNTQNNGRQPGRLRVTHSGGTLLDHLRSQSRSSYAQSGRLDGMEPTLGISPSNRVTTPDLTSSELAGLAVAGGVASIGLGVLSYLREDAQNTSSSYAQSERLDGMEPTLGISPSNRVTVTTPDLTSSELAGLAVAGGVASIGLGVLSYLCREDAQNTSRNA